MIKRATIIVFEGIDQSGKGTQAGLFVSKLKEMGYSSAYLHFHDLNTPLGKEIQLFLEGKRKYSPIVRQLLFAANRYERNEDIGELIKNKDFIIIDRYIPSGLAYGIVNGIELNWMLEMEKNLFQPDIVVLLDIASKTSNLRKPLKDRDIYEKDLVFLEKVRNTYLNLAKKFSWLIINGEDTVEEIEKNIWERVSEELSNRGIHI